MPSFGLFEMLDGMVEKVKLLPRMSGAYDNEGPVEVDIHERGRCSVAHSNLCRSRWRKR